MPNGMISADIWHRCPGKVEDLPWAVRHILLPVLDGEKGLVT
jgi:hypothetical protein